MLHCEEKRVEVFFMNDITARNVPLPLSFYKNGKWRDFLLRNSKFSLEFAKNRNIRRIRSMWIRLSA